MIGRLTGNLVECAPDAALLDVGGVGYRVQIPLSTYYAVAHAAPGPVTFHVHTHVREDSLALFGFATVEERGAFESLIGISGVGPKLALAVLSGIGVADLERAAREADRAQLERIPGVGRKTAERILIDLRDRLDRAARPSRRSARRGTARDAGTVGVPAGIRGDATSALLHLGYPRDTAEDAVDGALQAMPSEEPTLETVLKAALRRLVR